MVAFVTENQIETGMDWFSLINTLRNWFADGSAVAPPRQVLPITQPDGSEASLLLMPAWVPGEMIGVKAVTFFPANAERGLPTINAGYMIFDGATGQLQQVLDGDALTARRTAAASALAADYLARRDATRLTVIGTGQLAASVAQAHASLRQYERIDIWGRDTSKANRIVAELRDHGLKAYVAEDLETACRQADVISTVTSSSRPLVRGAWLRPGTHLDLVGGFRSDLRESDDQCVAQAAIFVDGRDGALLCGDLSQPIEAGIIDISAICADLSDLCSSRHPGRRHPEEFTVFKSAGLSVEDLAAASLLTPKHP